MKLDAVAYAAVLLTLTVLGCAKSNQVSVEGLVTLDDQPIAQGSIQFAPVDGQAPTAGAIIRDGHYRVDLSPGGMRVVINAPKVVGQRKAYDTPDSPLVDVVQESVPACYHSPSQLTATLQAGKNKLDFKLLSQGIGGKDAARK